MRNWTAQDKIRLGFWLLPLVPILLSLVAFRTASDAINLSSEVQRNSDLIRLLERMLSDIKDVEVAQREYVLTGDKAHLKDVEPRRKKVLAEWKKIKADYSFSPAQRNYIQALDPLIPQKFDELRHTVELFENGFEDRAKELVTGESQAMNDIDLAVRRLTEEELRRLDVQEQDIEKVFVRTIAVFVVFLIVNVIFIFILFRYMKREIAERKREEERFRQINIDLEKRVAQRTEALRRTNEDLQQFAYVASHDLQEPLRMVRSYMELLKRRYAGRLDSDADEFIEFAVDGTRRMGALIQALLDYSRAGEASDEDLPEHNTEESLRTAIGNLRLTIEETDAKLSYDSMPRARFDPVRLAQIFQNLISNAIKYRSHRRPVIHISAKKTGEEITFSVKDNGIGIAEEHQERIFGVFKRLHGREYEGTGIGLATVKKIVERHGGRIWVESKEGEGSTFYFTIRNHGHTAETGVGAKA